jgi:hypothetical protein
MQTRFYFMFAIVLVTAAAAFGQSMPSGMISTSFSGGPNGSFEFSATFRGGIFPYPPAAVTGAPYSGDEVHETVQTLADGGHITHTMPGAHVSRDAEGRTRVDRRILQRPTGMPAAKFPTDIPIIAEITDPAAGYRYVLDPVNHVAHRIALQARPTARAVGPGVVGGGAVGGTPQMQYGGGLGGPVVMRAGVMTATSAAPPLGVPMAPGAVLASAPLAAQAGRASQFTHESLGNQVINGVLAEGTRDTSTIPVGTQGNDRPLVSSDETWTSPDLKITVLRISADPVSGVQVTFRIDNLSRTPPDPTLFMPPADYTVVDETGSFTIDFGQ